MKLIKIICPTLISFSLLSISYAQAIDDQVRLERRRPLLRGPVEEVLTENCGFELRTTQQFTTRPPENIKEEVFEKPLPKSQETWDAAQLRTKAEACEKAGDIEGYMYYTNLAAEKEKEEDSDAEEEDKPGRENHRRAVLLNSLRLMVDSDPEAEREAKGNLYRIGEGDLVDTCDYVEKNSRLKRNFNKVATTVGGVAIIGVVAGTAAFLFKTFGRRR